MAGPLTKHEFYQLALRANRQDTTPDELQLIRSTLERDPSYLEIVGDLADQSRTVLINSIKMSPGAREFARFTMDKMMKDLGYVEAPWFEKLLIEQIQISYLRHYLWEFAYHDWAGKGETNLSRGQEWERLIAYSQKRFLRAIEMLARIRKLNIQIQVNIASEGGKQLNVANISNTSVSKKEKSI